MQESAMRAIAVNEAIHNCTPYSLVDKQGQYIHTLFQHKLPANLSYVGCKLRCEETGTTFTGESQGCSTNYARNAAGQFFSDAGVDIRERRELLDTSKPFYAYCSNEPAGRAPQYITGWKGNVLMRVLTAYPYPLTRYSYTHGKTIYSIRAVDVHGCEWYGHGNPGICITMRTDKAHHPFQAACGDVRAVCLMCGKSRTANVHRKGGK